MSVLLTSLEILSAIQRCLQTVYEDQGSAQGDTRARKKGGRIEQREKVTHDVALMDPGVATAEMSQVGSLNPLITQSLVPSGPLKGEVPCG